MGETVNLDVTTLEESVTVTTTDGGTVEVSVTAEKGDAATITVGTTTTGNAGTNASVTNSGTTSAAVLNFTIPRGDTGAPGPNTVTSATSSDGTATLSVSTLAAIDGISTSGAEAFIETTGSSAFIRTTGSNATISTTGSSATITTVGTDAYISTSGNSAEIYTNGANASIYTLGANAYVGTSSTFKLIGEYVTTLSHSPTDVRSIAFPDASGTIALTVSTAINEKIEMQGGGESGFVAPNYYAFAANSASLRDGNTGSACLTWGASGAQNLTVPSGTALTFDNTSYTYGTGAASAHRAALGLTSLATTAPGAGVATALAVNVGSSGAFVVNGGALGTPSSGTLTSCTGLPISTGVSGLGINVATMLGSFTSANIRTACTNPTGTDSLVFSNSPTLTTPIARGAGTTTGTAFTVQNSTPTTRFIVRDDGQVGVNGYVPSTHLPTSGYAGIWLDTSNCGVIGEVASGFKAINISANATRNAAGNWAQQDTARNSFILSLGYEASNNGLTLYRAPAGSGNSLSVFFTVNDTGQLTISGNQIRVATSQTPASATAAGTAGTICWDANYIYVCTATNTWKRTAISTW